MGVNRAIGYMGVAIQSARGTAASAAQFKFPIFSGGILPVINHRDDEISSASRNQGDPSVESLDLSVEFETRAYVGSSVMLLQAALGARSSSGTGDPYSHALSTGPLPYLTFWCSIGASDAFRISAQDVKADEVSLAWAGPGEVRLNFKGKGTQCDMTAADFDGTAIDESDGDGYFTTIGGTFQWDAVGSTAADFVCGPGGLTISNGIERVDHAGTLYAYDHQEGKLVAGINLDVTPASDLTEWIEVMTGSTTGSAPSGDVQFGKLNLVFAEAGAGTHTTTIVASRVPWKIDPIGVDGSAKSVVYNVSGNARYNATESDALDLTITNANAGTVYNAA